MPDDNVDNHSAPRERSSRWSQGGRDGRPASNGAPERRGEGGERRREYGSGSGRSDFGRGERPERRSSDGDRRRDDRSRERGVGGDRRREDRGFSSEGRGGERGGFRRDGAGSRDQRGRDDRRDDRGYGDPRDDRGYGDRQRNERGFDGRRDDRGYGGGRGDDRGFGDRRGGDRPFDGGRRAEGGYSRRDDRGQGGGRRDDRAYGDRRRDETRSTDRGRDERGVRGDSRGFNAQRSDSRGGFRRDDRGSDRRFDDNRGRGGVGGRGAGWSDEQASIRGPRSWDAKANGDERPRRKPEPFLPEEITGYELDKAVRQQLRTLSKENADGVAKHLVAAAELLDEDPQKALDHAQHAVSRAGRVPAAREALGLVLYRTGEFAEALREFRTARRLSGSDHLLPYMVDCERGLGRYERALELANSPEAQRLSEADNIELAIVVSGVRRDMGQARAAVVGLRIPALQKATTQPWAARLFYAYADALLDLGERDEARSWFLKADAADQDGETDAGDRVDQIDGFELTDLTPEDDQDVDPRLAEIDLSAFGTASPNEGRQASRDDVSDDRG